MEGEPSVENMAGPHSINQATLHLPKPNWPADALATSTLCVEINHIESEVGTRQLHWIDQASLCSPWMGRCVCLHGLLPYTQQIEHLSELHMKTIMERGCFSNMRWALHPFNLLGWLPIGWPAAVKTSYSRTEDLCKVDVLKSNYNLLSLNNNKWIESRLAVNISSCQCWCDELLDIYSIW